MPGTNFWHFLLGTSLEWHLVASRTGYVLPLRQSVRVWHLFTVGGGGRAVVIPGESYYVHLRSIVPLWLNLGPE